MIRGQLQKDFEKVLLKLKIPLEKLVLEHPNNPSWGDYATNLAMRTKNSQFANPVDWANEIVQTWRSLGLPDYLARIEVAPPGFINFWLKNEVFSNQLKEVLKTKNRFGKRDFNQGQKILLEHTSPNPQTTIMLGHLRNNFLGMTMARILEFSGAKVAKDCIVNDRGVHICRSILGYLVFAKKSVGLGKKQLLDFREITDQQIDELIAKTDWRSLLAAWKKKKTNWLTFKDLKLKPDHTNLIWYVLGSKAYELSEQAKGWVGEILQAWEAEEKDVWEIWWQIMDWSKDGYAETYKRVGSIHDHVWYESRLYKGGKELVEKGLKKGVFKKSEGAVVTNLASYGLSDGVVIKSDGTSTYYVFDLNLTSQKIKKFPSDLYIWDIGEEQTLYFKQLFALCEQLGIGKRSKFFHLSYALINFKGGGKMATRKGNVVMADEILDELHKRALEIIKSSNQELRGRLSKQRIEKLAEAAAVGAVKYSLLKFSRETTIYFDMDESLSLEGDSGPYLQYTYARCQSVLKKAQKISSFQFRAAVRQPADSGDARPISNFQLAAEELGILRTIYQFPEVIEQAARNFTPNLVCAFLFDLAQKYNLLYNTLPILNPDNREIRELRLALTAATAQVLKNGLTLLGIETPERM